MSIVEGGGGRSYTGPDISIGPRPMAFGNVTDGQTSTLKLTITNTGDKGLIVNTISFTDGTLSTPQALPLGIAVGASVQVSIVYAPVAPVALNATMTVTSNAISGTVTDTCTGQGVAAGTKAINANPSGFSFGSLKIGSAGIAQSLVIANTGTVAISIASIAPTAPYTLGGLPAFPYNLGVGATLTINLNVVAGSSGYQSITNAVIITSDAAGSPLNVGGIYTGFQIQPSTSLSGSVSATLFGTWDGTTPKLQKIDPNNLDCEESCSWQRQYDFESDGIAPGQEKSVMRVRLHYEDLGATELIVSLSDTRSAVPSTDTVLFGGANDGKVRSAVADVQLSHEILTMTFTRPANTGPLSITGIFPSIEPRGEYVERT